jgi:hypothetical protein
MRAMRIGTSWRTGPGQRAWVSMGPLGWLIFGLPLLAIALVYWTVFALVWLVVTAVAYARSYIR